MNKREERRTKLDMIVHCHTVGINLLRLQACYERLD